MVSIQQIQSAVVIGSGNVATHLATALHRHSIQMLQVYSPTYAHAADLAQKLDAQPISSIDKMNTDADLYLISISDDQIGPVSAAIPQVKGIVAHTSGITPLAALNNHQHSGVFYPLQTFSKTRAVDLSLIPFCIESVDTETEEVLRHLALKFSSHVHSVNSEKRKQLHLAAVLVNNFPTHLYHLAHALLNEQGMDFDLLRPLITETGAKVMEMTPEQAQTGPARRGDRKAIKTHLELLNGHPDLRALYEMISNQILRNHHE